MKRWATWCFPVIGFGLTVIAGCGGDPDPGGPDGSVEFSLTSVPGIWISLEGSGATSSVTFLEIQEHAEAADGIGELFFHSGRVHYDGNSRTVIGRFVLDAESGLGRIEVERRHILDAENEILWAMRQGARTENYDPPEAIDVSLQTPADQLVIETSEIAGEYWRLDVIFEDIEQGAGFESQAGAEQAVALLGALERLSKSRIDDWGGANIGSYTGLVTTIDGLSTHGAPGFMEMEVTGGIAEPHSYFVYDALTDFFGIAIDGVQDVQQQFSGSGSFNTDVRMSYQPFGEHLGTIIDLTVVDGEITAGKITGGSVTVLTGNADFSVDATLLQNVTTEAILGN
jgi:hypothetical protein